MIPAQNGIPWWYFQSHPGPLANTVLESVDPGGVIGASIEPERVVGCVVYCSAEIVEPGVIRHVEEHASRSASPTAARASAAD